MVLDVTTSPSLTDMTGTPFASSGTSIFPSIIRKP